MYWTNAKSISKVHFLQVFWACRVSIQVHLTKIKINGNIVGSLSKYYKCILINYKVLKGRILVYIIIQKTA